MTKKHYKAIAALFAARVSPEAHPLFVARDKALARELATILASDNPRFDRVRFLEACGF